MDAIDLEPPTHHSMNINAIRWHTLNQIELADLIAHHNEEISAAATEEQNRRIAIARNTPKTGQLKERVQCPTCGGDVESIFDHIDQDCSHP